jgi:hypothetical protein
MLPDERPVICLRCSFPGSMLAGILGSFEGAPAAPAIFVAPKTLASPVDREGIDQTDAGGGLIGDRHDQQFLDRGFDDGVALAGRRPTFAHSVSWLETMALKQVARPASDEGKRARPARVSNDHDH